VSCTTGSECGSGYCSDNTCAECTLDTQCADTEKFCADDGTCTKKIPCTTFEDCATNFCVTETEGDSYCSVCTATSLCTDAAYNMAAPEDYDTVTCGIDGKCEFTYVMSTGAIIGICVGVIALIGLAYFCGAKKAPASTVGEAEPLTAINE